MPPYCDDHVGIRDVRDGGNSAKYRDDDDDDESVQHSCKEIEDVTLVGNDGKSVNYSDKSKQERNDSDTFSLLSCLETDNEVDKANLTNTQVQDRNTSTKLTTKDMKAKYKLTTEESSEQPTSDDSRSKRFTL